MTEGTEKVERQLLVTTIANREVRFDTPHDSRTPPVRFVLPAETIEALANLREGSEIVLRMEQDRSVVPVGRIVG